MSSTNNGEYLDEAVDIWAEVCEIFGVDESVDVHPKSAAFIDYVQRELQKADAFGVEGGTEAGYSDGADDATSEAEKRLEGMVARAELIKEVRSCLMVYGHGHEKSELWLQIIEFIETGKLPWELDR